MDSIFQVLRDNLQILTFRRSSQRIVVNWQRYLAVGFFITWIVGMGRYWDNPKASLWQYAGLGSVLYVVCLAFLLWIILLPLGPKHWSYRNVLIFLTMTSLPALLYAIPVELFMSLSAAQTTNVLFLAVVATWRVALLGWFLRVIAGLSGPKILVGTLLPIAIIIVALSALNLEHVVFNIMAGLAPEERSANDAAYYVVIYLSFFSILALPILILLYGILIYRQRRADK